jgi:hypothetical protein
MLQFSQDLTGGTQLKNPKVKASYRQAGTFEESTPQEEKVKRIERRASVTMSNRFTRVPDIIAQDDFSVRNEPIPKGKEMFPAEWKMQFVDLFYPYSKDGPLYMDMPRDPHEIALCERKIAIMREKGMRYTYLKAGEAEWEGRMRLEGQDPDKIKEDQQALTNKEVMA